MTITINDKECNVPFDLSAIVLGEYRQFISQYGKLIEQDPDCEPLAWYSFWTGFDLFLVKDEPFVKPAIERYHILATEILKNETELVPDVTERIAWNDEYWSFQDFIVDRTIMSYNEIVWSREFLKLSFLFKRNPWAAMPSLCAIFFRKINEPMFIHGDTVFESRVQMMERLPMNIAMAIKNYITEIFKKDIEEVKPGDIETDFSTD